MKNKKLSNFDLEMIAQQKYYLYFYENQKKQEIQLENNKRKKVYFNKK